MGTVQFSCSVQLFCSLLEVKLTCSMNRICNTCSIEKDKNNYLKDRTVCKSCYNRNRRKNNTKQNQQQKIDKINNNNDNNPNVSTYEKHVCVIICPRNVGKTYYKLNFLEKICNKRPILIITRSPNQNPIYRTTTGIKPIDKYKGSVVVFDDLLGARNSSQINDFYTIGRHESLEVYYISQSFFALPRQSIRNNCDRVILLKQNLRDVQIMYYDIGAHDILYSEF